jgi:ribose-phosphate pyrophosphokinase
MRILFAFPGNETLATPMYESSLFGKGEFSLHHFPDGETLITIESDISGHDIEVLCTLDRPDEKIAALMFFSETARKLGAKSVSLISPYIAYMRQDKQFHRGESISAAIFADFLSRYFDRIVTIDPHLHRYKSMQEIYRVPVTVLHCADIIAAWIKMNIDRPVVFGPDEESGQWVRNIAEKAGADYAVFSKVRHSDFKVRIFGTQIEQYHEHTPVLVDDIISTAQTMIETQGHLKAAALKPPVCIGIHAIFAPNAHENLVSSGVGKVITCNTISHVTNAIDIAPLIKASCSK